MSKENGIRVKYEKSIRDKPPINYIKAKNVTDS